MPPGGTSGNPIRPHRQIHIEPVQLELKETPYLGDFSDLVQKFYDVEQEAKTRNLLVKPDLVVWEPAPDVWHC